MRPMSSHSPPGSPSPSHSCPCSLVLFWTWLTHLLVPGESTDGNVNFVLILLWQRRERRSKSIHHRASFPSPLRVSTASPSTQLMERHTLLSPCCLKKGRGRGGPVSFITLFGANINDSVMVTAEERHKHWDLLDEIDPRQLRLSACFSVGFRRDVFGSQQSQPCYNFEIFSL